MERSLLCAGFGGQGVMQIGKNVSKSVIHDNMNATFYPSYGAEMRGGTANCYVCLADGEIDSPVKQHPDELIVMNDLSYDKFIDTVKRGGRVYINSSLVDKRYEKGDLEVYYIPCADIAQSMNAPLSANMVMLGYYVANSAWLKANNIEEVIRETFAKKPKVAEINVEAFRKGIAYFNEDNH